MKVADRIELGLNGGFTIDGVPLPWYVGTDVEVITDPQSLGGIRVTIFADAVEVSASHPVRQPTDTPIYDAVKALHAA